MVRWVLLLALLVVPAGYAEEREGNVNDQDLNRIEPAAAADEEPVLLDQQIEEMKAAAKDTHKPSGRTLSASGMKVLSNADARAYQDAFARARAGKFANLQSKNNLLLGELRGTYLLNKPNARFDELNDWLKEYRDLPMAGAVYDLALSKRETPKRSCKTVKVTQKVKDKKTGKLVSKKVNKRKCTTTGAYGPMPVKTLAMEKREATRAARDAARESELSKMPDVARKALGDSWKLRNRKNYAAATDVLLKDGVHKALGDAKWQAELVRIADFYHGQRNWEEMVRAAEPASNVNGPDRDDARWLAGYGHYMMSNKARAADQWSRLVKEQPANGKHTARAAWWGARALSEMGQETRAKALLEEGAKDPISFYGQLSAAKLGRAQRLDWSVPQVDAKGFAQITRVDAAKRGLALAQIGEIDLAQRQLRAAYEDLPYQATRTLAAAGVRLGLPSTALYAARQLIDEGEILPGALFPLAEEWEPKDGWTFDRALMLGIMRQESAFNPQIGSHAGAQGLMQLMPATAKYIARLSKQPLPARADLHDPAINLNLAQAYLKYLNGKLDGNLMLVVASYNGGIGNVRKWLDRGVTPGHDPMLWLENIPFNETRDYVEKVFANYWLYQQRMKQTPWSLAALADGYWPLQWNGNRKTALRD